MKRKLRKFSFKGEKNLLIDRSNMKRVPFSDRLYWMIKKVSLDLLQDNGMLNKIDSLTSIHCHTCLIKEKSTGWGNQIANYPIFLYSLTCLCLHYNFLLLYESDGYMIQKLGSQTYRGNKKRCGNISLPCIYKTMKNEFLMLDIRQ